MDERFRIAIIGAGPAGLAAAAHAANMGISHVLLEASPRPANTIYRYQKGKLVMDEPSALPLRSPITFAAGPRETILEKWDEDIRRHKINLRVSAQVDRIAGERGNFMVTLSSGQTFSAEVIVLAIGLQGNIHKLGVPGEDLPSIQYQLDDPEAFRGETIVVVGGGDSGVENALALTEQNRVILVTREKEFSHCKESNFNLLRDAIKAGKIETRVGARVDHVEAASEHGYPLKFVAKTFEGTEIIACHRIIARLGASPPRKLLESFGVRFPNENPVSVPELSERYESNVPGLYIVGALGGYPLIKQALNQGYEVIEHILGRPIEPADEPLLKQKISMFNNALTVNEGLAFIKRNSPIFSGLSALQLREILLESSVLTPRPSDIIFKRNEYSSSFFSVLEGELAAFVQTKEGGEAYFQIRAGNFFGEMGLISGRSRSATIKAVTDCVLIETPRRSMLKLINSVESVQRKLDEVSVKRVVRNYLTNSLQDRELDDLARGATIKRYEPGEVLFREGDKADGLYLIRRGSVVISRTMGGKEDVLSYVAAGNYIGGTALISGKPRSATARAASATETIILEASMVTDILERNETLRDILSERSRENILDKEPIESRSISDNLFTFLVKQGVGEATNVLLIDYSLCIRCNNCERACADNHSGIPLLDREAGPTHGYIHVPTSCRHCVHPHCMKDCPPDAIQRAVTGEVFINDNCIGCGNCIRNCPYDVIQLKPVDPGFRKPGLWLALFGRAGSPRKHGHMTDTMPKRAVKCDLCKDDVLGPACVRSCPTGASMRLSPESLSQVMRGGA